MAIWHQPALLSHDSIVNWHGIYDRMSFVQQSDTTKQKKQKKKNQVSHATYTENASEFMSSNDIAGFHQFLILVILVLKRCFWVGGE